MLGGEVVTFARVGLGVEQLPALHRVVGPHVGGRRRHGRCLPALMPDRPRAAHRVELRLLVGLRLGVVERGGEADALDRVLGVALDDLGRLDPERLVEGRDDVDCVRELSTHSGLLDPLRPRHDHRVGRSALPVAVALPQLERGVERTRPSGRIVVVGGWAAKHVQVLQVVLDLVGDAVEVGVLVDRAAWSALAGCAVVRDQDDDCVVELAAVVEVVEQPPDLVVGVAEEACVDLRHPREQALLVIRSANPMGEPCRPPATPCRQRPSRPRTG